MRYVASWTNKPSALHPMASTAFDRLSFEHGSKSFNTAGTLTSLPCLLRSLWRWIFHNPHTTERVHTSSDTFERCHRIYNSLGCTKSGRRE